MNYHCLVHLGWIGDQPNRNDEPTAEDDMSVVANRNRIVSHDNAIGTITRSTEVYLTTAPYSNKISRPRAVSHNGTICTTTPTNDANFARIQALQAYLTYHIDRSKAPSPTRLIGSKDTSLTTKTTIPLASRSSKGVRMSTFESDSGDSYQSVTY